MTLSYRRGISGLVPHNPLEGQAGALLPKLAPPMVRKFLLLIAAAAALAAAVRALLGRRSGRSAETNGGLERTEELRREIEAARTRLRESIRSQEG